MNAWTDLLQHPLVNRLGWTLLHFLWQGVALGIFAWLLLTLLHRRSSQARYGLLLSMLTLVVVCPVATFLLLGDSRATSRDTTRTPMQNHLEETAIELPTVDVIELQTEVGREAIGPQPAVDDLLRQIAARHAQEEIDSQRSTPFIPRAQASAVVPASAIDTANSERYLSWLVVAWCIGVTLLALRMIGGWWQSRRWMTENVIPLAQDWQPTFDRLLQQFQSGPRAVRWLQSTAIRVPITVGWLKPVVLLPASMLTGLPADQVECLIAHELAHISRHDYLVNLLQCAIEVLLFYHPVVWWLSRRIRQEREEICDELAIRATGDRMLYSRALLSVATLASQPTSIALAADGGDLTRRVKKIHGLPSAEGRRSAVAALACIALILGSVGYLIAGARTAGDAEKTIPAPLVAETPTGEAETVEMTVATDSETAKPANEGATANVDKYGDPLPNNVLLRLGTIRFRQQGPVDRLVFTPDGKRLLSTSINSVIVWDAATGKPVHHLKAIHNFRYGEELNSFSTPFRAVDISPDGRHVAAIDDKLHIWDIRTGRKLHSFPLTAGFRQPTLKYSPDGKKLAMVSEFDQTFRHIWGVDLYDVETGQSLRRLQLEGHRAEIHDLAWSPDSRFLATCSKDPNVLLWDVKTGELHHAFEGTKEKFAHGITISPNGQLIAATANEVIHVWEIKTEQPVKRLKVNTNARDPLAFLSDQQLLFRSPKGFQVWDISKNNVVPAVENSVIDGRVIAFTPDRKTMASGTSSGQIRLWNLENQKEISIPGEGHHSPVESTACSPDGALIASATVNEEIRIWDASSGEMLRTIPSGGRMLAFAPQGNRLASLTKGIMRGDNRLTSGQATIQIRDPRSGAELLQIPLEQRNVVGIAFSDDGQRLVSVVRNDIRSGVNTDKANVWDAQTGEHLHEFEFDSTGTTSMALTPGGKTIALGARNGALLVRDLESGQRVELLSARRIIPANMYGAVSSLAYSPDGKFLASCCADKTIRIWEQDNSIPNRVLTGHRIAPDKVAFSPDGQTLASISSRQGYSLNNMESQRIRLWNVRTGKQIGSLQGHDISTSSIAFSPDGKKLVSGHGNSTVLVWDVNAALNQGQRIGLSTSQARLAIAAETPLGKKIETETSDVDSESGETANQPVAVEADTETTETTDESNSSNDSKPKENANILDTLSGTVVLGVENRPVAGATVYIRRRPFRHRSQPPVLATITTNGEGRFDFKDVPYPPVDDAGGTLRRDSLYPLDLIVTKPDHSIRWQKVTKGQTDLQIKMRRESTYAGILKDDAGQPVSDATVRVTSIMSLNTISKINIPYGRRPNENGNSYLNITDGPVGIQATTDGNGRFLLRDLPARVGLILDVDDKRYLPLKIYAATTDEELPKIAVSANYEPATPATIDDPPPVSPTGIVYSEIHPSGATHEVERGIHLTVKVIDAESGEPVEGAGVYVANEQSMQISGVFKDYPTDKDGTVQFYQQTAGRLNVVVKAPEETTLVGVTEIIDLKEDDNFQHTQTIKLEHGSVVTGRIVDNETGEGVEGAQVYCSLPVNHHPVDDDGHDQPAVARPTLISTTVATTDEQGNYRLVVPDGENQLRLGWLPNGYQSDPDDPYMDTSIMVMAKDHQPIEDINFTLTRKKLFRIDFVGPDGQPIAATVTSRNYLLGGNLQMLKPESKPTTQYFYFPSERTKALLIIARSADDSLAAMLRLQEIKTGDEPHQMQLLPVASVTGVVTDKTTGKPIAGAQVSLSISYHDGMGQHLSTIAADKAGRYQFDELIPNAKYSLGFGASGFNDLNSIYTSLETKPGEEHAANVSLEPIPDPVVLDVTLQREQISQRETP